jgi:hypothetical protein
MTGCFRRPSRSGWQIFLGFAAAKSTTAPAFFAASAAGRQAQWQNASGWFASSAIERRIELNQTCRFQVRGLQSVLSGNIQTIQFGVNLRSI